MAAGAASGGLVLSDVAVAFGALRAVDGVSLSVPEGERRGIIGPNGAGNLLPSLTVRENLFLALRGRGPGKFSLLGRPALSAEEEERAEAALAAAHLSRRAGALVQELSYGEQRQVELALAIAARPRLLLLDEPAAGLSPSERAMIAEVVRGLPRGMTLLLIEHDMDLVLGLVDRVTCLHQGRVLLDAAPEEVRRDEAVQEVYLGRPRHA